MEKDVKNNASFFNIDINKENKIKNVNNNMLSYSFNKKTQLYGLSIQSYWYSLQKSDKNPLIAVSSIISKNKEDNIPEDIIYNKEGKFFSIFEITSEEKNEDLIKKDGYDNDNHIIEEEFCINNIYISEEIEFPLSKIMFSYSDPDILATTDVSLSLYKLNNNSQDISKEFCTKIHINKGKDDEESAPLTSFDWNTVKASLIVTSSYDSTCTIWNVDRGEILTRLFAHDKEVFDVGFLSDENVFLSCGADASVRLFDLRDLENSNILFETNESLALTRLSICLSNNNYFLTTPIDKSYFYVMDLRDT